MAADVTVKLDQAAINDQLSTEWFRRRIVGYGTRITAIARTTAPRRSGRGAASIHGEAVLGPDGWEVRVSWDIAHAYMALQRSHAIQDAAYQVLGK